MKNPFYRKPDFVIGPPDNPYLRRWHLTPRNRFFSIYLHNIVRSDDDRAKHDHPGWNVSILLRGAYKEWADGKRYPCFLRKAPGLVFRRAATPHRLELLRGLDGREIPVWSLFIMGPRVRTWGFHCPKRWVPWYQFTNPDGSGVGPGCGDVPEGYTSFRESLDPVVPRALLDASSKPEEVIGHLKASPHGRGVLVFGPDDPPEGERIVYEVRDGVSVTLVRVVGSST